MTRCENERILTVAHTLMPAALATTLAAGAEAAFLGDAPAATYLDEPDTNDAPGKETICKEACWSIEGGRQGCKKKIGEIFDFVLIFLSLIGQIIN